MRRGRLRLALAGAVLLHVLLAVALYPRPKALLAEPDLAVSVQIVRRAPSGPLAQIPKREVAQAQPRGPIRSDRLDPPEPLEFLERRGQVATVAPPVPDVDGVRRILRQRAQCADLSDLTERDRRACEARYAADRAQAAPAPKVDLSRAGLFGKEAEPYLARKPVNGCKVMTGGRAAPSGQEGAVAGVGCALSF